MKEIYLSVIIPAYNEASRIGATLLSLDEYFKDKKYNYEIIVVNDGSDDTTSNVVRKYQEKIRNLKLIDNKENAGKGYAVRCGMLEASGTYRLFMDADNSVKIDTIEYFLPEIESGTDIVVGSIAFRGLHSVDHTGVHRKILRVFAKRFIHLLLPLSVKDTQRGFKLFTKRAADAIFSKSTINGFLFDVEALVIARSNRFTVKELPVEWDNPAGSKIQLSSYGSSARELMFIFHRKMNGKYRDTSISSVEVLDPAVKGKGFKYGNSEFIHHSDLHHTQTALYNLLRTQKIWFIVALGILAVGFILSWHTTLVVLIATMTIVYFFDLLFNLFLIYRSFSRTPELVIPSHEYLAYVDQDLPVYTIFCPLYKEWQVVPQFVAAMQELDYPKDKLQIMFLLEENDTETIEKIAAANLPPHFEIVVVPHSKPKTKPKAMNYGLRHVRGEYLVIYDAEDVPETDQLKKAVAAFSIVDDHVVCIQAKLNFYNPHQNTLTKVFTAEYSLWFDLVLPGLQSINAPIPLGGTSNHFKVSALHELAGWDAFNVTEDADLGMRLAKQGYRTAILDSTTHEEANSGLINWYNQRSRWIKGYIQTYFVHTRDQRKFIERGSVKDMVIFHLNIGGKVLSMFINPFMWLLTFCYFIFRASAGSFIESLFPDPILYIGVFSLIFGNFLYLYYYMIGCAKRGYDTIIKYVFLVPFYWMGMSFAAWRALYEVIVKPHYWSKTVHGLHLQNAAAAPARTVPEKTNEEEAAPSFWGKMKRTAVSGGGLLMLSTIAVNMLNLSFNVYLGNRLSLESFGVVTALNTLVYLISIAINAFGTTIVHQVARLSVEHRAHAFFRMIRKKSALISYGAALLWIAGTFAIASYLHIQNGWLVVSFAPALIAVIMATVNKGYLQGQLLFKRIAAIIFIEAAVKLIIAVIFVETGFGSYVALSLPISMIAAYIASVSFMTNSKDTEHTDAPAFATSFYAAALATSFSAMAFMSVDVFFAKHYLNDANAGEYSLLSLVGKMIFFFGSILNIFIVPLISRSESEGNDSKKVFMKIFAGTLACAIAASVGLVITAPRLLPLVFGEKGLAILPYIHTYAFAMVLLTISNAVVLFHLARRRYLFSLVSLVAVTTMVVGIARTHATVSNIVSAIVNATAVYTGLVLLCHLFYHKIISFFKNVYDVLQVFSPLPDAIPAQAGKKRILIFNWRCLRHAYAGGAEVYIETLARNWAAEGHSVTLFCGNDRISPENEYVHNIRIIRRGGFYTVYVVALLYYLVKLRGKFDVIIDCENGIPFFTPIFAKEPVYCLVHHVHQEVFRTSLPWPLAPIAMFMERKVMPMVYKNSCFITVSESSRQDLHNLGITQRNIEVIHPGVDLSFLKPASKHDIPTIAYIGRLKEYKCIDVLIRAFAMVLRKVPEAQLIIAGTGEAQSQLEALVNDLRLDNAVQFLGRIDEETKRTLLQKAWVCVNPSRMEGWGITTIEANACGTPVIASDVPGLRDSVRDGITGFLFPHGDSVILASEIVRLIKDKKLQKKLSVGAVAWSREFTWEKSALKFLRVII